MTKVSSFSEPALNGTRSISGKIWRKRLTDERLALALSQKCSLPDLVSRVLVGRGVDIESVNTFLTPSLRKQIPDPSQFLDMDQAVARIIKAIKLEEGIGVFGDYDVDGATSAALLMRFFCSLDRNVHVHIPDRRKEGYGPNLPAILRLKEKGVTLIITVDCGTTAFSVLEEAKMAGIDIIVIDHHAAENRLPAGAIVVNPNRMDENRNYGQLAAVGVTFMLVIAINRALRNLSWYGTEQPEPDLLQWLDLVALGTICDVVPLIGINRALVKQGLRVLAARSNPGINALAEVACVDRMLNAYHAGFILGPRINAGGRVGKADLGVKLLSSNNQSEVFAIAEILNSLNKERQQIEQEVYIAALDQAKQQMLNKDPLIFVAAEGWHVGVIGIVAGRLRETFDVPACVVAIGDGIGIGSARSVTGIGLGSAVIAAQQSGLLLSGGGHSMAAGFTVGKGHLLQLHTFLKENVNRQLNGIQIKSELLIDGVVSISGAVIELVDLLEQVGPFGAGNSRPRFLVPDVFIVDSSIVGNNHVRCVLSDKSGKQRLKGIAFRKVDTEVGDALLNHHGLALHVAGTLRTDNWQGRNSVQMFIEDICFQA